MTWTSTTLPNAVSALLAVMRASVPAETDVSIEPVQVLDGDPLEHAAEDYVVFKGVHNYTQAPAGLGSGFPLEESYELEFFVRSWRGGPDLSVARNQALLIFADIEAGIRADVTLGGAIRHCWISSMQLEQGMLPKSSAVATELSVYVACKARIS